MANNFSFTIDTSEMAAEIKSVSNGVKNVSGAVIAMQTAVIAAEKESTEHICKNVNKGFYTLMHSQISQKIAQLTSTVEAKLFELAQYAAALKSIKSRMTKDYNMISGRYTKLFKSINNNLEARIAELDMPVFKLVDRDIKLIENRIRLYSAQFSTNQLESILSSQLISTSKIKIDAKTSLNTITEFIRGNGIQEKKTQASMQDTKIDSIENIYIPVSIFEYNTSLGNISINYFIPKTNNIELNKNINNFLNEHSANYISQGSWENMNPIDFDNIKSEFNKILLNFTGNERVKDEIIKMFNNMKNVQQLKPYEL